MFEEYIINDVYIPFLNNEKRYLIFYGGAGSGKSVFVAQKVLMRILSEEGHRFLCIRKVASTLRSSVFQLFKDVIVSAGVYDEFNINKSEMRFTHVPTGNEILLAGLDDPEKLKSIQGITSIWIEEATDITFNDFTQLDLRLRGITANYKQIILSFNPVDESSWIKPAFFDTESPDVDILRTDYRDNHFLDEEYKRVLNERVRGNENYYRIYVLGQWGKIKTGGEFYKCFSYNKHVSSIGYNAALPLHLTWDFNVNPYVTLLVWQMEGKRASQIDEICLESPKNRTIDACREFQRKYFAHESGVFIYGDPAGRHEDTRSEKGFNDYKIIERELERYNPILRVASKAPPVVARGNFINLIFESNFEGIEILIDEKCKKTIEDFQYLKQASDGTKHKEKKKHELTGVTFEALGHCSDSNDYFLLTVFDKEFRYYQSGKRELKYTIGAREFGANRF